MVTYAYHYHKCECDNECKKVDGWVECFMATYYMHCDQQLQLLLGIQKCWVSRVIGPPVATCYSSEPWLWVLCVLYLSRVVYDLRMKSIWNVLNQRDTVCFPSLWPQSERYNQAE